MSIFFQIRENLGSDQEKPSIEFLKDGTFEEYFPEYKDTTGAALYKV